MNLLKLLKKEPLVILGIIATVAAGVYDEATNKHITNWRLLLPIVVTAIGRQLVTSALTKKGE